ncbi:MAG: molybdopterin-containing oxidoreductase family protein [Moorellales bacterium]
MPEFRTACGGLDHGGCGLVVRVEGNYIVSARGDPAAPPPSAGYSCHKASALGDRLASPYRLTRPLLRQGPRGAGKWKEVSWSEALDFTAENLKRVRDRYGPEAVVFMQGAPKGLEYLGLSRFAHAFGSPNLVTPASLCFMPRVAASLLTCGYYPLPDYSGRPGTILVWGSNLTDTNADGVPAAELRRALANKPKLIVVDPRRTELAKRADIWLRLRPGSDSALALAFLKVIIEENRFDQEFVRHWTLGFDQLAARAKEYSLESLSRLTWLSTEEIVAAARLYAEYRPGCLQWGNAIEHSPSSTETARMLLVLAAICGDLEVPGGNIRPPSLPLLKGSEFTLNDRIRGTTRPIISADYPMAAQLLFVPYHLAVEAMLAGKPYPVKAAYLQGTNPLLTYPDSRKTYQALTSLEFMAVAEVFMTPTAALADVVLPVATRMEHDDLAFYTQPFGRVVARPKLVDPPEGCRSDLVLLAELADRLGLGELFWKSEEECINNILAPAGIDYARLRETLVLAGEKSYFQYRTSGFRTPSGKVEIAPERLAAWGLDPVPAPYLDLPEPDETLPLLLTSAKSPHYFHSAHRHIARLREREPEPVAELHPDTASRYGIGEGDPVRISTRTGSIVQKAKLNPDLHPLTVIASYGWWFPERGPQEMFGWQEANLNLLTAAEGPSDPLVGSLALRGLPCRVERV